ncbi:MAG: hypothetical protein ABFC89_04180 [Methanospirillum sp.]
MKAILFAAILLVVAALACGCTTAPAQQAGTATTPNLTGNWTGTATGYLEGTGFTDYSGGRMIMSVTSQKDRIFEGKYIYPNLTGSAQTVGFAGAVARDGRTLTIVETNGGYSTGTLVTPGEIELIFADDSGPIEVAIDTLKKS